MKKNIILPLIAAASFFASCDDTTDGVGFSLTDTADRLSIVTDTFYVNSETVKIEDIVSRSSMGYLGKIKDEETGSYITGNIISQLHTMENYDIFPAQDSLVKVNGEIIADSCKLYVLYATYYGDSTISMKCKLHEMAKPLEENEIYTVDFQPTVENGYIRKDGIRKSQTYSILDHKISDKGRSNGYQLLEFDIPLNDEYTDAQGNKYSNYGTYIMKKYYEDPTHSNFKNNYRFTHNVCPGFYLESTGGLGCIANVAYVDLCIYAKQMTKKIIKNDKTTETKDTIVTKEYNFSSTEELIQKTNITQDNNKLEEMLNEGDHTYLKTPAGLYTKVSLPVEEIFKGHENDTLNTARVFIPRENNTKEVNEYTLRIPQTVLILPSDSVETFFRNNKIADNRSSYLASYSSATNGYTFSNISNMMRSMRDAKVKYLAMHPGTSEEQYEASFPNWNKATIIPVVASYTKVNNSQTSLTRVAHDMSIACTKLAGGKNTRNAIKVSCIYSKFQKK